MDQTTSSIRPRIALVWRGEPDDPPSPKTERFDPVIAALRRAGADPIVLPFSEPRLEAFRRALATMDGVLVWVDPLDPRGDRRALDLALAEAGKRNVWLGAAPDVILKMGAKSVLVATKALGWGVDSCLHRSAVEMEAALVQSLLAGPRVIKRNRGNGGQGVWKVEWVGGDRVAVIEAQRGSEPAIVALGEFCHSFAEEFAVWGFVVDQPYQPRLAEGMIRTYVCQGLVVGFGLQKITALLWPPREPGPRIMRPADHPPLGRLRGLMETDWIPGLLNRLGVSADQLPALWDADFLFGPKASDGRDSYVLCEINASSVAPFPESAIGPLSTLAVERSIPAMKARHGPAIGVS